MTIAWRPARPFAAVHWSFSAVLFVLWLWIYLALPCEEGPAYLEACALTALTASAVWIAWFRFPQEAGWRRLSKCAGTAAYDLFSFAALCLLLTVPLTLIFPTYQCYTPRAKVSELVLAGAGYRAAISERAERQGSLTGSGEGIVLKLEGRVSAGAVSADGAVALFSHDPAALVIFRPSIENGKVRWKCSGFPLQWMPSMCKELPSF